jgi:arabinose-5-phosphate isomerase
MSRHPKTIAPGAPAIEAATVMDANKLSQMLVLDGDGLLLGALHMHDLLAAKVI